nr:ATP-binding protein [uncultured Desulfuromonas sp.]
MLKTARSRLTLLFSLALAVTMIVSASIICLIRTSGWSLPLRVSTIMAAFLALTVLFTLAFHFALNIHRKTLLQLVDSFRNMTIDHLSTRADFSTNCVELATLRDEYNAMLDRLEIAVQRVRQFSGDASHELRTPLTILRGETEVTLHWAKTPEEFRAALQSNMEEIDRMGRILEDLLTLAKSESGDLPLSIRQLSLSDLLQELYLQGTTLAEPKNIKVSLHHGADSEVSIRGDDLRLRQLFLNLLSNAIRYTPDGGTVDIDISREGDNVTVAVIDSGIGISAEHLPHIFERFYRTDEARNRADGGTGLGLAIVKWITEAHDGTIHVNSTVDQGSRFEVHLPVAGPTPIDNDSRETN